jgi:hypothetical protein
LADANESGHFCEVGADRAMDGGVRAPSRRKMNRKIGGLASLTRAVALIGREARKLSFIASDARRLRYAGTTPATMGGRALPRLPRISRPTRWRSPRGTEFKIDIDLGTRYTRLAASFRGGSESATPADRTEEMSRQ